MAKQQAEKRIRVKMNTDRAGAHFMQKSGEVVEVEVHEAKRLIASGQAEPVPGAVERAVQVPRRHAMA